MRTFYPLVDASIRYSPLLNFVLNACSEVDINFVLFQTAVYFIIFYCIIWGSHYGDPMGITLLKSTLSEFFIFCRLFSAYFARLILPVFSATEFE